MSSSPRTNGTGEQEKPPVKIDWRNNFDSRSNGEGCMHISNAVKLVALAAIVTGICVTGTSSWVLHRAIQAWRNPTLVTANRLLSQVNTFFGGTTGLYDLDVIYRILTSCSATGFIGGIAQFFSSLWLLLASEKGGHSVARIWLMVHVAVIAAVGGSCLCILTNELEIHTSILVFLCVTGIDLLLILFFSYVVFLFSNEGSSDTAV